LGEVRGVTAAGFDSEETTRGNGFAVLPGRVAVADLAGTAAVGAGTGEVESGGQWLGAHLGDKQWLRQGNQARALSGDNLLPPEGGGNSEEEEREEPNEALESFGPLAGTLQEVLDLAESATTSQCLTKAKSLNISSLVEDDWVGEGAEREREAARMAPHSESSVAVWFESREGVSREGICSPAQLNCYRTAITSPVRGGRSQLTGLARPAPDSF
jgi:hypothetical protein